MSSQLQAVQIGVISIAREAQRTPLNARQRVGGNQPMISITDVQIDIGLGVGDKELL